MPHGIHDDADVVDCKKGVLVSKTKGTDVALGAATIIGAIVTKGVVVTNGVVVTIGVVVIIDIEVEESGGNPCEKLAISVGPKPITPAINVPKARNLAVILLSFPYRIVKRTTINSTKKELNKFCPRLVIFIPHFRFALSP